MAPTDRQHVGWAKDPFGYTWLALDYEVTHWVLVHDPSDAREPWRVHDQRHHRLPALGPSTPGFKTLDALERWIAASDLP